MSLQSSVNKAIGSIAGAAVLTQNRKEKAMEDLKEKREALKEASIPEIVRRNLKKVRYSKAVREAANKRVEAERKAKLITKENVPTAPKQKLVWDKELGKWRT